MDRSELAHLEHENMIASLAIFAGAADGALVRRADGIALIATGLPMRLFNQVLVEGTDATHEAMAQAVAATRARADRFVVSLRVGEDDRHVPSMTALGLVPLSAEPWMPGMALHPLPTDVPAPGPGHEIVQVHDEAGIDDHITAAEAGFELPAWILRAVMGPAVVGDPSVAIYVGYTDGEPVSTGIGVRTGRTIGVYTISTIPAARGKGYGSAMTRRVAADGVAAGCDVAILQASDMGYPIYEHLGYSTVVEYMGYVDPASPSRASASRRRPS